MKSTDGQAYEPRGGDDACRALVMGITHKLGSRQDRIPGLLDGVTSSLEEQGWVCERGTVSWQPQHQRVPLFVTSHVRFRWLSGAEWFNRGVSRRLASELVVGGRLILGNLVHSRGEKRGRFLREVLVEKHLACWRLALDLDSDVLVVLEDDAVEADQWDEFQRAAPLLASERPTFFNLGGGNDLSRYPLESARDIGPGWRRGRLADTAVAYCVNRAGLEIMANSVAEWPHGRRVGADAMISGALMRNKAVESLFPPSPLFLNGTIEGIFSSELPTSKVHKSGPNESRE